MRVAIFTSLFSNHLEKDSGIGIHYRDLAIGLKEYGCKVEVFRFPYECNQSKDYVFESIPIHVLGLPTAKIPRFKGLGFLAKVFKYFDYYEATQLLKTSKNTLDKFNLNRSFDVIETTSNRGVACGISRLRKRPPIFTRVSTTMKQSFAYEKTKPDLNFRLAARLEEEQIKRSDFLVTHTQSHSRLVSKELSLENSKFKIIPHAISLNQSENPDPKSNTTSASIRILFVGRLEPRKGFDVLMKAIPIVLKENNNIHFDICGDGEVTKTTVSKLYFSTENEGNHKIVENSNSNDSFDTKVVKLSSFLETHAPRLIKMDIEGAELLALRGLGADYLKNNSVDFVIEYHHYEMSFFNIEGEELLDFFIEAGYKFRNLATGSFSIIDKHFILKTYTKEERGITNLFCSKTID